VCVCVWESSGTDEERRAEDKQTNKKPRECLPRLDCFEFVAASGPSQANDSNLKLEDAGFKEIDLRKGRKMA
jgi:hypothetical protein